MPARRKFVLLGVFPLLSVALIVIAHQGVTRVFSRDSPQGTPPRPVFLSNVSSSNPSAPGLAARASLPSRDEVTQGIEDSPIGADMPVGKVVPAVLRPVVTQNSPKGAPSHSRAPELMMASLPKGIPSVEEVFHVSRAETVTKDTNKQQGDAEGHRNRQASLMPSQGMGTILAVTPGDQEMTLTWDPAYGGSGFSVYYGTSPEGEEGKGVEKFCPQSPCVITGLTNGTTYYFAVTETDISGRPSQIIVATASAIPMSPLDTKEHVDLHPGRDNPVGRGCASPCLNPTISALEQSAFGDIATQSSIDPGKTDAPPRLETVLNDTIIAPHASTDKSCGNQGCIKIPSVLGKEILIETRRPTGRLARKVAVNARGNKITVWPQWDGRQQVIWASSYISGGWQKGVPISRDPAGDAFFPEVAMDSTGNAIAVWYQSDGTRYDVWANRFVAGLGWEEATRLETGNGEALFPHIAVDLSGFAIAVWFQHDGVRYNIWANRYLPGSGPGPAGWGGATRIEAENAGSAFSPRVALDSSGNAVVVWYQSDGKQYNIWANRFIAGSHWKTAARIASGNTGLSEAPQVIVDSMGNAIVAWRQDDNRQGRIWANRFVSGLGWGTARPLEVDTMYLALDQGSSGR